MSICEFEILVSDYLDGELSPEERARFEAHLKECDHCQVLVAHWKDVEAALKRQAAAQGARHEGDISSAVQRELSRSGAFRDARRRSWRRRVGEVVTRRWHRYAAAAVALVVLAATTGYVQWRLRPAESDGKPVEEVREWRLNEPTLAGTLADAEKVVTALVSTDRQPGEARILQQRVIDGRLTARVRMARAETMEPGMADVLIRLEAVLVSVENLPDNAADQEADVLRRAIEDGGFLGALRTAQGRALVGLEVRP